MRLPQKLDLATGRQSVGPIINDDLSATVKPHVHHQLMPSTEWVVDHPLSNAHPAVVVVDSAGTNMVGEVVYDTPHRVRILFSAEFGGTATIIP